MLSLEPIRCKLALKIRPGLGGVNVHNNTDLSSGVRLSLFGLGGSLMLLAIDAE